MVTCDASTLDQLLGDAVLAALMLAKITIKEAAGMMSLDESVVRKGVRGEAGINLNRLIRLPFVFWMYLSPSLIYLVAKRNAAEIADGLGLREVE